jgi:hypothetical protein
MKLVIICATSVFSVSRWWEFLSAKTQRSSEPQPDGFVKEGIRPACEAGGQSDSPRRGSRAWGSPAKRSQPMKWATERTTQEFRLGLITMIQSSYSTYPSVASFAGSDWGFTAYPRLGCGRRLGLSLCSPASQASWMFPSNLIAAKNFVRKKNKNLRTCYTENAEDAQR